MVGEMLGIDLVEFVTKSSTSAIDKWNGRRNNIEMNTHKEKCIRYNPLLGIGNAWCDIIRLQSRICIACKIKGQVFITNAKHLEETHGIETLSYQVIWDDIRNHYIDLRKKVMEKKGLEKLKREDFRNRWEENLKLFKEDLVKKLGTLL